MAALAACLCLLSACAIVEPPPGGPIDQTPPHLVSMTPDSGAVGLGEVKEIRLVFSEKMDRKSATGWLYFFPDQRIRKTSWKGATEAVVELEEPLPADTLVVVEVAGRMADAHKVKNRVARRFPLATADSIPGGTIAGVLVMGDTAVVNGVVELYAVPPDTVEYFQTPLLRRTATDRTGGFVFSWLPVPGGPWLLRAFVDKDGNLRPGDGEAKRLVPDTVRVTVEAPAGSAGVTTLYAPNTPGRLLVRPFANLGDSVPVVLFTQAIGDVDTGWNPKPLPATGHNYKVIDPTKGGAAEEVVPGRVRLTAFVDVDRDTAFGVVPDSLIETLRGGFNWALADSAADTSGWYLEPILFYEATAVEPGLEAWTSVPDTLVPVLTPWVAPPPPPAPPDTTAAAAPDSTGPEEP